MDAMAPFMDHLILHDSATRPGVLQHPWMSYLIHGLMIDCLNNRLADCPADDLAGFLINDLASFRQPIRLTV